jgi:hypothetical protein
MWGVKAKGSHWFVRLEEARPERGGGVGLWGGCYLTGAPFKTKSLALKS